MKKWIRNTIIIVILVLLILGAYAVYFYSAYDRIADRVHSETKTSGSYSYFADDEAINAGRAYNIMTYNISYGFHTSEYSSYDYGGKYTRADSEEAVMANLCDIADVINKSAPDFILLQGVDMNSTRSYHVNELELINEFLKGYYYSYAQSEKSPFLAYPLYSPKGQTDTALATYSVGIISENVRRSLPITDTIAKYFEPDRCYMVTRIPLANEKKLCIYNVQLSKEDEEVKEKQLEMLFNDMAFEYKMGNYIVCGGDFGMNLRKDAAEDVQDPSWAMPFPRTMLPEGFKMGIDCTNEYSVRHDSCRDAMGEYVPQETFTATTDGFIVSDNILVNYYNNANWQYKYSNHDPVLMQIYIKG